MAPPGPVESTVGPPVMGPLIGGKAITSVGAEVVVALGTDDGTVVRGG